MAAQDTQDTLDEAVAANGAVARDAERRIKELAERAETVVRERADELKERARDYYDEAADRLDTAQRFITERVQEKPVAATLAAVGVGVVIGLLLAGRRR